MNLDLVIYFQKENTRAKKENEVFLFETTLQKGRF